MKAGILLKSTLLLVGCAIMLLGLNTGLGGIRNLGWQILAAFLEIADQTHFQAHDSHVRFLGGVWFGIGVVYLAGGIFFDALRQTLVVLCAVIAAAGLFRLCGTIFEAGSSPVILPLFAMEVLGFPCLGWWLSRPFKPRLSCR